MQDYIIIANGNRLVKEIIVEAAAKRVILALDGATNKLVRLGIKPQVILGDFDSISDLYKAYFGIQSNDIEKPYLGHHGVTIVPAQNQAYTDLTKAIHYCDAEGAKSITIVCALGGRLDHHEGVMRTLRAQYKKGRPILLHTEQQTLRFAKDETLEIHGEIGDKCGVVAFPQGRFTSQGLEYEATDFPLQFGISENTCNALIAPKARITIQGEALLIMPPHLAAQRAFLSKSEIEQLEWQLRDAKANYRPIP